MGKRKHAKVKKPDGEGDSSYAKRYRWRLDHLGTFRDVMGKERAIPKPIGIQGG